MNSKPSRYDDGKGNWDARQSSFDDWLAQDKPQKFAVRLETADQVRARMYQDRSLFEPEIP